MKLLLTSGGMPNASIVNALRELFGKGLGFKEIERTDIVEYDRIEVVSEGV